MNDSINWANLVANGRAKAHGIPWTEEEAAARSLGIPAEFVREGVLTMEDYGKAQGKDAEHTEQTGEKPVNRMNKAELMAKATSLGIEFTPDVSNNALKDAINAKLEEEVDETDSEEEEVAGDSESKDNV